MAAAAAIVERPDKSYLVFLFFLPLGSSFFFFIFYSFSVVLHNKAEHSTQARAQMLWLEEIGAAQTQLCGNMS
jgi:hypothetical protein